MASDLHAHAQTALAAARRTTTHAAGGHDGVMTRITPGALKMYWMWHSLFVHTGVTSAVLREDLVHTPKRDRGQDRAYEQTGWIRGAIFMHCKGDKRPFGGSQLYTLFSSVLRGLFLLTCVACSDRSWYYTSHAVNNVASSIPHPLHRSCLPPGPADVPAWRRQWVSTMFGMLLLDVLSRA
jgi:hypothetical protein